MQQTFDENEHDQIGPNEWDFIRLFYEVLGQEKVLGNANGDLVYAAGFGYCPPEYALKEMPEGSGATERIVLAFNWGYSQIDIAHQEPVKVVLDVPRGAWRGGNILMMNLYHCVL